LEPGEYEITADDGASNTSTKFIINWLTTVFISQFFV
jgi:hypothetical protein